MINKSTQPPRKKPGRVSLPPSSPLTTPTSGNFFAGIGGKGAPAKNTQIPNLTQHVVVAKAKVDRLKNAGLLSEAQREATAQAEAILAKSKPKTTTAAPKGGSGAKRRSGQTERSQNLAANRTILPPELSKPAVSLDKTPPRAPAPASSSQPPTGSRGAPPLGLIKGSGPKTSGILGSLQNAASVGLGTALEVGASVPGTLLTPMRPGATRTPTEAVKPTHLVPALTDTTGRLASASNKAAAGLQGAGLSLPKTIPSVDLVPTAGAASQTEYTPQALVAAGLTEKQTTLFRERAKKQGWYDQEIDGLVGLDLIKHAYSKPPPMALRVLQNFGAGVIRTAALPQVPIAIGKEVASGHGLRALKEFGDVAAKQFGGIVAHPGQAAVSDPYAFVPIAGGTLKTLGGIGGKVAEKAGRQAVERSVTHAVTGEVIPRGPQARNLYTATGQALSDKATSMSPRLSRRADAQRVDKLVADVNNESAPLHHGVQTDYAKAFKSVGEKRATVLASINKAGGKPEKILAKYQADGNKRQVKHWTQVVEAQKNLSAKDRVFLDAHKQLGAQTTGTHVELGRFSDTAGIYRSHQPLILSDAHAGDPGAQRVQALHDEWVTTLRKTDDPAVLDPMFGAYDHAVREYAAKHLSEGGAEPTRVAYTPPLPSPTQTSRYRTGTGGRVRFNRRVPKQPPSTGAAFESGNYLIDPKVALRENLQAQRLRTSVGLTSDESMQRIGAKPWQQGELIPEGYTFTPKQNPATVGKVISDLHDQPVGAHDYYHQESNIRERFATSLKTDKQDAGEYSKTEGWLVPTGSFERILDYTRPESRNAYDRFMRQYQRAMISIYPSTVLGNTVGSIPLALAGGAVTPRPWLKAIEASRDPSITPHSIHGIGVAGNLAADARNPVTKGMNFMRAANVKGEDFSRNALYLSRALKGADKRAKELGYEHVNDYLRDMASGKVDVHVRDDGIKLAIKFAGNAAKPATKATKHLGRYVLFPQWLQHMTKVTLVTLPIQHPRRMALINALAAYGDQYRKENGSLPSWMQEFAPLFAHTMGGQEFTRVAGLGQLAPQGSAGGVFDSLSQNRSFTDRAISLLNPPVTAAVKTILQERDNRSSPYPVDLGRFALNQALYTVPGMSKFFPRTGMESSSLPWDPQRYTIPYKDPDGNSIKPPWAMRPGARPVDGPLGIASRVFGLPLYDVPAPGSTINKREVGTAIYKAKHPKKKKG